MIKEVGFFFIKRKKKMMCSCVPSVLFLFCSGKTESVGGEGVHSELFEKNLSEDYLQRVLLNIIDYLQLK
jgi:hypothetical protein